MTKLIVGVNDLATVNPELAKEWNYEKNEKNPQDYTASSGFKVWWLCNQGHEYQSVIYNRTHLKRGCPYCAGQKAIIGINDFATLQPQLTLEWNYVKNSLSPQMVMPNTNKKVWWVCSKCGYEWNASPNSRVNSQSGCPMCANNQRGISESLTKLRRGVNDLVSQAPYLLNEWSFEKNTILPQNICVNFNKKVWWKCKKGHEWQATPNQRFNLHSNCPYCTNHKILIGFNDLETLRPDLVKEWNYIRNTKLPRNYTISNGTKVWWICNKGHEWQAQIRSRTRICGSSCPYCSGSKTERLVYTYLKNLQIPFIAEKKFGQDIKVKFYPFDVWISSKRLIIEPDGEQHFSNRNGYFEQDTPFEKRREHDNIKNDFCLEQRIPILRIPYIYNPDTEKDKIEQMVLTFLETRKVPQEIIDFYEQYSENNNYSDIARQLNTL